MLIIVQLVQIGRAQTTFENMRGNIHHARVPEAITSTLVAGTTSLEEAQLTPAGMGPDPLLTNGQGHRRHHREGFLTQWKRLLGLDTFVATAQSGFSGSGSRRDRNPFSRGVIRNCKDFFCDGAPIFGKRETGSAMLGGEVVNYTRLYDTPPRTRHMMRLRPQEGGEYQSVLGDDSV